MFTDAIVLIYSIFRERTFSGNKNYVTFIYIKIQLFCGH